MSVQGLGFLDEGERRILMFCGKGGTGKTTSSSVTAVHFAQRGYRTLLISTDPAPSLSDILEIDVGGEITPIPDAPGLSAVELDYDLVVELWKERYGAEVYDLISSFLPVEEDIIEYIAGAPGIDQEFALGYLYDLYAGDDYDVIIWDTAPAGGTLALIKLQDTFYTHLGEAARMYVRVRSALEALTRGTKKNPLRIIAKWEELSKNVLDMMKDESTQAIVVTNPEALCVAQTRRVVDDLEKFGIRVGGIVLNRVLTEEAADSPFNRNLREVQLKYIQEVNKSYQGKLPIAQIPLMGFEVKGVEALLRLEKVLYAPSDPLRG
ncbi:MAG: ArsA family ATPase [Candidatus Bathyarchaeia archaeon]